MSKVAVVILNWNGKNFLEKFLPGVISNSVDESCKVYVADNGSSDGSTEYVQTLLDNKYIIRFSENYGFAFGYAKALSQIKAEYFVLLNSDVEVVNGWIKPIIELMDKDSQIAACMPKIKAYENREYFEYAGAAGGFLDRYGFPFCRGRILTEIEKDIGQYNNTLQVFWATGACLFVKAKHYYHVGGLDSDFFAHMEEIDLCWRFNNAGYKVMVYPGVHVFHVGGGTLPNNNPHKLYLNFRNSLYMLYKNLPKDQFKRTFITRLILDGVAAFKFLFSFQFSFFMAVLRAHLTFWKKFKMLKQKRKDVKKLYKRNAELRLSKNFVFFDFFFKNKKRFYQLNI